MSDTKHNLPLNMALMEDDLLMQTGQNDHLALVRMNVSSLYEIELRNLPLTFVCVF